MCRANAISTTIAVVLAALLATSPAHSQTCEPSPDGFGCTLGPCGVIPEDKCLPTAFRLDVATGAIKTEACACQDFNLCHVVAGNASFFAEGNCPTGHRCELVSVDTNNDGIDDFFTSVCAPAPEGICCLDIDDGPLAYDTCEPSRPDLCGGLFHDAAGGCENIQACCIGWGSSTGYCQPTHPACCVDSGGVPLGPGSTCDAVGSAGGCPVHCGGIAGIQCPSTDQFCMLPPGGCCCDFMGVCMVPPSACPDVWDPVCGCDGQTYGNACDAAMASMSIDHRGACGVGACCVTTSPTGPLFCFDGTADECANAGGEFSGPGTSCGDPNTVACGDPIAACCLPDGSCADLPIEICFQKNGVPAPPGVMCDVVYCSAPTGACCLQNSPNGVSCLETDEYACVSQGGKYQGDATSCPPDASLPCFEPTGACCTTILGAVAPVCEETTERKCLEINGAYLGDGTVCNLAGVNVCPAPIGACCVEPPDGTTPYCTQVTPPECFGLGGIYLGDGASCPFDGTAPCDSLIGACCTAFPDVGIEACFEGTRSQCADAGGEFQGEGVICPPNPSLGCSTILSACCFEDGTCTDVPFEVCVAANGYPGPLGSQCDLHACPSPPTGACCLPNAAGMPSCQVTTHQSCADLGGDYQGDNTPCPTDTTTPCVTPTGACCRPVSGAFDNFCEETTEVICAGSGGSYLGDGTTCPADGTNLCPPPTGACCLADPTTNTARCFVGTAQACANEGGSYLGDGTECPPDADLPCQRPMGACCFAPPGTVVSTCAEMTLEICTVIGGHYLGDGATCPDDPALACPAPCPALCGVHECLSGCGTLVQGVECLLFGSAWGTFLLSDYGGFGVGDRVHVTGCVDPFCVTTCMQGDGCIQNYEISSCGEVCGGIAGIPCSATNEFCSFPIGTCGDGDIQGVCTPIPGTGCPENYDPVCGCDGVTYGNECEAAAAGMSIAHRGACDMGQCAATRRLGEPDPTYCPGQAMTVHIGLNVPTGTTVIAVEDAPPLGWEVTAISNNGSYDATNGKVKWGPFFAPFPQSLNYVVVPAPVAGDDGPKCFTGVISIDGVNRDTCGDQCMDAFCRPFMPVDVPQPPCPNCPLSDCNGCDNGACQDGRISLCEVISYACSWKTGCNDDLSGMTRAAFIWMHGECYCWDEVDQVWLPSSCASPSSGVCSDLGPRDAMFDPPTGTEVTGATATVRFSVQSDGRRGSVLLARIAIQIHSPASTSAAAMDFHIPPGWTVLNVGSEGEWDEANRKVKWGPYFEDAPRAVFVTARKTLRKVDVSKRDAARENWLRGFYGTVSFDGLNEPVTVKRRAGGVR